MATIAAAPSSATSVRLKRSVTMTTYAVANTTSASTAVRDIDRLPGSATGPPTRLPGTPARHRTRAAAAPGGSVRFARLQHVALEALAHQRAVLPGRRRDRGQHTAQRDHPVEAPAAVDDQRDRCVLGVHHAG